MIEIIPAIDIIDGKCVRLSQGDFSKKRLYNGSPIDMAKRFEGIGIERLHLVDLDGARTGIISNMDVLSDIAANTNLIVDFGGGVRSKRDIESVLNNGASMVNIGSIAVKQPQLFENWLSSFGADKIILGTDVLDDKVVVNGWQEQADIELFRLIKNYVDKGLRNLFCTDISKDGMLQGPSIGLYEQLFSAFSGLYLIASGGVSSIEDIDLLEQAGCQAVIIGKAIYEGLISLSELEKLIVKNGIN